MLIFAGSTGHVYRSSENIVLFLFFAVWNRKHDRIIIDTNVKIIA